MESIDHEQVHGEGLNLTAEQANDALKAGRTLYDNAIFQRNRYRDLLARVCEEYGNDAVLTIPNLDQPDARVQVVSDADTIEIRRVV